MMDYVISDEVSLPSGGKVYSVPVNPHIKLRSMSTNEEMKRLSPSDRKYKNMAEVIDACMVEPCGISSYDMCLGDYQYLLYKLRTVTYGPEYQIMCHCPYCASDVEETISMDELKVKELDQEEYDKYTLITLPQSKHTIKLKLQTAHLLDDVTLKVNSDKKKHKINAQGSSLLYSIQTLIEEIDGEKPNLYMIEDFIRDLPMMDTNYILKCIELGNDLVGIDDDITITCEVCGLEYHSQFRITREFYGPTINI